MSIAEKSPTPTGGAVDYLQPEWIRDEAPTSTFTRSEILASIPHGDNFIWLLDRAEFHTEHCGDQTRTICTAYVTVTEEHCRGHFKPPYPMILPFVALIELGSHTAEVMFTHAPGREQQYAIFDEELHAKKKGTAVKPGDVLEFRAWFIHADRRRGKAGALAIRHRGELPELVLEMTFEWMAIGKRTLVERL